MTKNTLSLLLSTVILSSMSNLSFANTDKCDAYKNSLSKAEVKANERLSEGKARSANSQVKTFERTLRSYTKANCPDIDKFTEQHAALKHRVNSAINKEKCLGYEKKLDGYEGDAVNRLLESGDIDSATRLAKSYDKELKRYVKASCNNVDNYQKKLSSYMAALNSGKCQQDEQKMQLVEGLLKQLTAVENPESPRNHRGDINRAITQYSYFLDSYKKNLCAEEPIYAVHEEKVAQWKISADPVAAYEFAIENDDTAAAEQAINAGIDITGSTAPLELAIKGNAVSVVQLLVDKGVNLNKKHTVTGLHPLNFPMDTNDKNLQLNMVKLLLSLGADIAQSNSNRIVELTTQVGDLELLKQLENTPLTVTDYTTCYWSSEASQKELQRYCLNKMKAIGFNERWKDQTEGMKDKSLAKEILRQGNAFVVGDSKRTGQSPAEMEKVKIRSRDWKINRNELGIILSRQVTATGLVKNKHGVCYLRGMNVVQSYAGDSYVSTPSIEMLGKKTIDCN